MLELHTTTIKRVSMSFFLRLFFGSLITTCFIWVIFKSIDFDVLAANFLDVKPIYLVLAICFFFVGYSCRIERWRLLLTQENKSIKWQDCAGPLMGGVAINNVLPFRAGDVFRAFAFNKRLRISNSGSLTALFIERLLDLLMLALFLSVALGFFGVDNSSLIGVGRGGLILTSVMILLLLFSPRALRLIIIFVSSLISNLKVGIGIKLTNGLLKVFATLEHTSQKTIFSKLILWSLIAWIAEGLVFWFVALSIPNISNHLASWIALPVGTFATLVPSSPGHIGTFDYFTAKSMTIMGNSPLSSAAFAFMVHAILWVPPTLVGGIYLITNRINNIKE